MNEMMWREIEAQPSYLRNSLASIRRSISDLRLRGDRVVIGGCGDSYYAAVAVEGIYRMCGIDYAVSTSQSIEQFESLTSDDLVVLSSTSGSTRRTIAAALESRKAGAHTLAITCNADSPLSRQCDQTLVLPYQPLSRSTPHTLDYIMSLLAKVLIAERLRGSMIAEMDDMPDLLEEAIRTAAREMNALAAHLTDRSAFYYLGAGPAIGTCMYSAAKMHESGGVLASHGETENFWHGMNFVVRPGDCVVVFENQMEPSTIEQSLIDSISRLTSLVLYVGTRTLRSPHRATLLQSGVIVSPFLQAVVSQMICYSRAMALGVDVEGAAQHMANGKEHGAAQRSWLQR